MTSLATHIFRCDGHVLTVILAASSAALSRLYDACHVANQPCPKFSRRCLSQLGSNMGPTVQDKPGTKPIGIKTGPRKLH